MHGTNMKRGGMFLRNFVAQSVKTADVTSQKTVVFGVKQSVVDSRNKVP